MNTTIATAAWCLLCSSAAAVCDRAADSSRIAVAGGSLTEIVYLLGAEARIVAVDSTSDYPAAAARLPSLGYVRNLSAEGVLSSSPTLLLGEDDMGPPEAITQVADTGVEVVRIDERHDAGGILEKVRCVGTVLGLRERAERLIAHALAPRVASLRTAGSAPKSRIAILLGVGGGRLVGAGRGTSGDGVLQMIGAENALGDVSGWKPITIEGMAKANPDFIVLPQRSIDVAGGLDAVAADPALALTAAARAGRIIGWDGMALLGFGPRTLVAAVKLRQVIRRAETPGPREVDRT